MTISDLTSRLPALSSRIPSQSQIARMFAARTRRSPGEFAAVFALGLLIGGATALLRATKPGKELRRDLSKRVATLRERAKERIASNGHAKDEQHARL